MATFDLEPLLAPLSDEAPSGENLEYDAAFLALERAAAVRSERSMGDSVKQAEEPDWPRVADAAQNVLARSRDLRVAVHLATAWTRTAGLPGWSAGLALIRGLLEQHWDTVHPQLDADDDHDPTLRVNSVAPLGDPLGLLAYVRNAPLAQSPRLGRFSLRDLRIANGSLKPSAAEGETEEPPALASIEACCLDCAPEQLAENTAAAAQALEHAKAIDTLFNDRVGTAGPQLKALLADAYELKTFLERQLALRMPQVAAASGVAPDETGAPAATAAAPVANEGIHTPQDVMRCLDDLCDYYARKEPSSPVPLLLRRAQRLVGKNFLDLLKDLAPGGLSELQVVSGQNEESE